MRTLRLEILWTKKGTLAHSHRREVSLEIPTEGETTEVQDALLSLPGWTPDASYGESRTVRLPDPLDALTDEVVLEVAIPQLCREIEAKVRKEAEKKEASRAKRRAKLEEWLGSGETHTPWGVRDKRIGEVRSERHPSYSRDVMNHSLSDEALGWLDGHDDLRQRVEARIAEINATAHERGKAKLAASDDVRDATRVEQEARDAAKQAEADARAAEIAEWAMEYGSERLHAQLALGLQGWPLYLHERMDADWPASVLGSVRAELDNDGESGDALVNPTIKQIKAAKAVAKHAVELGLAADMDAAVGCVEIVPIEFAIGSDNDYCSCQTKNYVTFSNYRPGGECFARKQIRFACEES